jgi:hypothetical protein
MEVLIDMVVAGRSRQAPEQAPKALGGVLGAL